MKSLSKKLREHSWNIGFIEDSVEQLLYSDRQPEIRWVKNPYKDRWFADPFILKSDNKSIVLLVEEFSYDRKIGRIARIEVDRHSTEITDMRIILEKETHLSFPLIIRRNNTTLVIPENFKSGIQTIYRLNESETKLEPFFEGSAGLFTDAVIFDIGKELQMITTEEPDANGCNLNYYSLDTDFNIKSSKNTFKFSSRTARNGGAMFRIDDSLFRPAQICDNVYGEGIEIQEVKVSDDSIVGFVPVKRFMPASWRWNLGLHTFNIAPDDSNLIVIDGHGYRYFHLGKAVESVAKIKRSILR